MQGWGVGLGNLIVAPVDQIAFASWGPRPGLEVAVGFPCVVHPFTHGLRMKFHSAIFDPVGPYRRFFFRRSSPVDVSFPFYRRTPVAPQETSGTHTWTCRCAEEVWSAVTIGN